MRAEDDTKTMRRYGTKDQKVQPTPNDIYVTCCICKREFITKNYMVAESGNSYCSQDCLDVNNIKNGRARVAFFRSTPAYKKRKLREELNNLRTHEALFCKDFKSLPADCNELAKLIISIIFPRYNSASIEKYFLIFLEEYDVNGIRKTFIQLQSDMLDEGEDLEKALSKPWFDRTNKRLIEAGLLAKVRCKGVKRGLVFKLNPVFDDPAMRTDVIELLKTSMKMNIKF